MSRDCLSHSLCDVLQIIQPILARGLQSGQLQKPILVITITDGEPTGEPRQTVANVIKQAKNMCMNSRYGPGAITFEFAQVRISFILPLTLRCSFFPALVPGTCSALRASKGHR